jgi:hypothetical protein
MEIKDGIDIAQLIVIVFVAIPAFLGLNTWRVQLVGRKKVELAEEALTLAYELQEVIEYARCPLTYVGEGENRERRDQEDESVQHRNDVLYSRVARLSEYAEEFARLRTVGLRFRAYFGEQAQDAITTFAKTRMEIFNAVSMLMTEDPEDKYELDLRKELKGVVWSHHSEKLPNEIKERINDAVVEIEGVCRPVLTKL